MEIIITILAFMGGASVLKAFYEGYLEWANRERKNRERRNRSESDLRNF